MKYLNLGFLYVKTIIKQLSIGKESTSEIFKLKLESEEIFNKQYSSIGDEIKKETDLKKITDYFEKMFLGNILDASADNE
jgi:hypothetical protein